MPTGHFITEPVDWDQAASSITVTSSMDATDDTIEITVYQDTADDGTADNQETVSLSGGEESIGLSSFTQTQSSYWLRIDFQSDTTTNQPSLDSAQLATAIHNDITIPLATATTAPTTTTVAGIRHATVTAPTSGATTATMAPTASSIKTVIVTAGAATISDVAPVPATSDIENSTVDVNVTTVQTAPAAPTVASRKPVDITGVAAISVTESVAVPVVTAIGPGRITGEVVAPDGTAVADVGVAAILNGERDTVTTTDANGQFELEVSDERAEYHIVALTDDRYYSYPYTTAEGI